MNEGKNVLEELHKLWEHHANYLREMWQRKDHEDVEAVTITPNLKLVNESWSGTMPIAHLNQSVC